VDIGKRNSERRTGMQEEREAQREDNEEVEGHRYRTGAEDAPQRQDQESDDEDVEAHRWRYGPEEFGKRF
jgi:hypothetical protein